MKSSQKSLIAENWVVNSSPVIALGRVGQIELITRLPQKVVIPQAVKEELLNAPKGDPARTAVESGLFEIIETPPPSPEILAWDLGKGETAVLSYRCPRLSGWQFWMTAQPVVARAVYPLGLQVRYPLSYWQNNMA